MTYTVSEENYNKAIEWIAMLNCDLRQMERNDESDTTAYNTKQEMFLNEECLLAEILGIDVREIDDVVCARALELDKAMNN